MWGNRQYYTKVLGAGQGISLVFILTGLLFVVLSLVGFVPPGQGSTRADNVLASASFAGLGAAIFAMCSTLQWLLKATSSRVSRRETEG